MKRISERDVVMIALFAALVAVLGLVPKLTLASGIPITAQTLGIMLCGTVLGAWRGAAAAALFCLLTLIGLPLLAGGRGGLGVLLTPWAGFFVGFPVAAFVAGLVMERMRRLPVAVGAAAGAVIGGIVALYAVALVWYMVAKPADLGEAVTIAALPFIPGDIIKAVLAALVTQALAKARPGALPSRG
ncbi:biotin transporter BioY [Vannielia litorea]|uniref:biotin transporter BioY n=1 Tax=Vannielia litorea TaxID=1217970 RepID=UPI001BCBBA56|nr:biotin transporter BioY [Vannielia litorea]MBS8228822.1 biotin transporter BioY [Vannielia litorea]